MSAATTTVGEATAVATTTATRLVLVAATAAPPGCDVRGGLTTPAAHIKPLFMADELSEQLANRDRLNTQGYTGDDGVEGFIQPGQDV
jgi:hypothetical protein